MRKAVLDNTDTELELGWLGTLVHPRWRWVVDNPQWGEGGVSEYRNKSRMFLNWGHESTPQQQEVSHEE